MDRPILAIYVPMLETEVHTDTSAIDQARESSVSETWKEETDGHLL